MEFARPPAVPQTVPSIALDAHHIAVRIGGMPASLHRSGMVCVSGLAVQAFHWNGLRSVDVLQPVWYPRALPLHPVVLVFAVRARKLRDVLASGRLAGSKT